MALDDVVVASGGGRPPRAEGSGFRNTAGKSHMKGATLQEIAQAPDDERCARPDAQRGSLLACLRGCAARMSRSAAHARSPLSLLLSSVLKVGAATTAKKLAVRLPR